MLSFLIGCVLVYMLMGNPHAVMQSGLHSLDMTLHSSDAEVLRAGAQSVARHSYAEVQEADIPMSGLRGMASEG